MGAILDIDILCKVVDNYGDIGFAYRLARSLSERPDAPRLRLVVDDFDAFALLDPAVDPSLAQQVVHGWELYRWRESGAGEATASFRARRPRIVLECFACGRPDWLEAILFEPGTEEACLIVDIEHLTAEAYADDFHHMPSLTRSPRVKKAIFLPGFTAATGGLVVDESFARARLRASSDESHASLRRELLDRLGPQAGAADSAGDAAAARSPAGTAEGAAALRLEDCFWVCVFSYERDYGRIIADLASYQALVAADGSAPLLVLAAAGRSQDCFVAAWSAAGEPFPLIRLPFLPQEIWDELLLACDFSIVRGEDSWARAALAGNPFLWQAYPQENRYQLVKVAAFLEILMPHFITETPIPAGRTGTAVSGTAAAFSFLRDLYMAFNDRDRDWAGETGQEEILSALTLYSDLMPGFRSFSESLARMPDLASRLLTFLREIV